MDLRGRVGNICGWRGQVLHNPSGFACAARWVGVQVASEGGPGAGGWVRKLVAFQSGTGKGPGQESCRGVHGAGGGPGWGCCLLRSTGRWAGRPLRASPEDMPAHPSIPGRKVAKGRRACSAPPCGSWGGAGWGHHGPWP